MKAQISSMLAAILLIGCSDKVTHPQPYPPGWSEYRNTAYGYSTGIPAEAFMPNKSPSADQIFFGNIKLLTNNIGTEYDIYLYTGDNISSCSTSITGASTTTLLSETRGDTIWGKVDAYDYPNPDFPPDTQPRCRPPILKWDVDMVKGVTRLSDDAAYVLCSEKDGKTVLICVSQVTDNPDLARKIFETFRWTE